ncbi:MAG: regulator [Gammaproteobacteria bacterium]|nr:regulator [Gammaproteobacteria bacterium]MDH5800842.1 regulator [Gammaproteobacteria bacterium]
MNINTKALAALLILVGGAIVAAYTIGMKQGGKPATAQSSMDSTEVSVEQAQQQPKNLFPNDQANAEARFTHFRVGNRNVKGMVADGNEVWVGTSGGAIRYDLNKENYKLYDVKNGSLISNGVFHLSKVRDKIMVGTYGGGMSVYDPKADSWKNYNIPDGLADQFVYDIDEDEQGNYWIATWSGVNFVPGGKMEDSKGWKTFTVENTKGGLPNDWVYGVEVGRNGDVWFATEGGLARFDKHQKWTNWQHDKSGNGLGAAYEKVKDDIAFSNDPAKASKHHATQKAQQGLDTVKVGYNPNYIVSMIVDTDGAVWCGTWGAGLSRFDGKTWTTYTTKEGLPGNHVFMLKNSKKGRFWIGTNKGLARFNQDGKSFSVMNQKSGLYADNVFSMAEAADGSLWVGSFGGVARLSNLKL